MHTGRGARHGSVCTNTGSRGLTGSPSATKTLKVFDPKALETAMLPRPWVGGVVGPCSSASMQSGTVDDATAAAGGGGG